MQKRRILFILRFFFTSMNNNNALALFPFLAQTNFAIHTMKAGTTVFREGEQCGLLGFIIEGTVRVYKHNESGREITLYRITAGESCILSIACIMSSPHHKASAIIEEHTTLAIVQAHDIRHLLSQSAQARDFIFALLAHRLADVVTLIDEIVFSKMDKRLAHFLLNNKSAHNTIHATHEHIAIELGTAREVISRLLKDFESKGYIALNRGSITIIKDTQLLMY